MEAIETCRTDALGGRVERCLDCGGELPTIAYANKAAVYDLLFRGSSQALMTIAADPKHLGARIGIPAVLHTPGARR